MADQIIDNEKILQFISSLNALQTELIVNGHVDYAKKIDTCILDVYPERDNVATWKKLYGDFENPDVVVVSTQYVVSGINASGTRVYRASDTMSGGYPYWSEYISSSEVRRYGTVEQLQFAESSFKDQHVTDIGVFKVETVVSKTTPKSIIDDMKAKAERDIADIRKKLDDDIKKLNETH